MNCSSYRISRLELEISGRAKKFPDNIASVLQELSFHRRQSILLVDFGIRTKQVDVSTSDFSAGVTNSLLVVYYARCVLLNAVNIKTPSYG